MVSIAFDCQEMNKNMTMTHLYLHYTVTYLYLHCTVTHLYLYCTVTHLYLLSDCTVTHLYLHCTVTHLYLHCTVTHLYLHCTVTHLYLHCTVTHLYLLSDCTDPSLLTLHCDSHLSADGRWDVVASNTLIDIVTVTWGILYDDHLSCHPDLFKVTMGTQTNQICQESGVTNKPDLSGVNQYITSNYRQIKDV